MVDTLAEKQRLNDEALAYYNSLGIETIRVDEEHTGFGLAKAAAAKLLEEEGVDGEELDLIIYIRSRLPEFMVSSEATRLQYELGATNALVFSLTDLGCADMSMALKQAVDFLKANRRVNYVLICYGCKPATPDRYRYPVTINGDGGIAVLVARTEANQVLGIEIKIDGSYWNLFRVEYQDKVFQAYKEEIDNVRRYGFELAMESRNRFLELNERILRQCNTQKADVDHFILQNISARAYAFYETAFDVKISSVCPHNLARYGHLGASDVLLNYHTGLEHGLFKTGDKVLIMNNSPVAAWSSILMQV